MSEFTRRDFISSLAGIFAGATLLPSSVLAQDLFNTPLLRMDLPQLKYPGNWNPRPHVMRELGLELRMRTRLEPLHHPSIVEISQPQLFATPFLYIAGEQFFPHLRPDQDDALRLFVDLGGMLVFDSADGGVDHGFEQDVQSLLARILPGSQVAPISRDHVLHRSFYLVDEPVGRTKNYSHIVGIQEDGRLKAILLHNDLGGALARDEDGLYLYQCSPGGAKQREWAIRFAVNILLYATCTDYKSDRAHMETLLRSRKWR